MIKLGPLLSIAASLAGLVGSADAFTNPIRNPDGGDPFVTYSPDGFYYFMTTTGGDVSISRSNTVGGLAIPETKVIYTSSEQNRCCNIWAPEVHQIGDRWYVYFTAGSLDTLDDQRPHVLVGGATPWDDYSYGGQQTADWGIDATVVRFEAWGNYLAWSCLMPDQSMCMAKLGDDNISLSGPTGVISTPDQEWENHGQPINEGPAALYVGGVTRIAYSASHCSSEFYCLATLTWDGAGDPATAETWAKSDGCVLTSGNGHFGTGHNSFFSGPSGSDLWIAYHATGMPEGSCGDDRYTMVQQLAVNGGDVDFGTPVDWGTEIAEPA